MHLKSIVFFPILSQAILFFFFFVDLLLTNHAVQTEFIIFHQVSRSNLKYRFAFAESFDR